MSSPSRESSAPTVPDFRSSGRPHSGPSAYRAALTAPGAGAPALFSALGRLPVAMYGLAILLYVQGATGSFATAGLVSAGSLVGVALGSVVQGRWVDRRGPTRLIGHVR